MIYREQEQWVEDPAKPGSARIWKISLRTFAALCVLAVKNPLKQLTAKSAKTAKFTQRLELRPLPKARFR